jgi:DNA-binding transcriptional MocR family regulator
MMTGLGLKVEREGDSPLYRQIAAAIIGRIESGLMPAGTRLPTVRELAEELSVARVTAHRAYAELRRRGVIDATVGRGTFVVGPPDPIEPAASTPGPATPETLLATAAWVSRSRRIVSLEIAEPDPAFYPATEFLRILQEVAAGGSTLFGYGWPRGDPALRHQIGSQVAARGLTAAQPAGGAGSRG